jgi:hypothetical protein
MADPADRLAAWVQAAIRVEDSGDATHFAPLCRVVSEISRREREFVAKAVEGFQGCRFDVAIEVRGARELAPPELWGPIANALSTGNMAPLLMELRRRRDFDQGDLDALARIFWMLKLTHGPGHRRAGTILPSPAELKLHIAAELITASGIPRAEAVGILARIDSSLDSKKGERGGKLMSFLSGRRGSASRLKRRR